MVLYGNTFLSYFKYEDEHPVLLFVIKLNFYYIEYLRFFVPIENNRLDKIITGQQRFLQSLWIHYYDSTKIRDLKILDIKGTVYLQNLNSILM